MEPTWIQFVLVGYLVGSIPFGLLIAKSRGVDLRASGSGNVGATNVGRTLGKKWGLLCFVLDVLKGFAPTFYFGVLIAQQANGPLAATQQTLWLAGGCATILGHVFPVWLKFKGGKGVATSLGVVLGVWPYLTLPGLAAFALWIVVTGFSRYVSLGSVIAAIAFVPILFAIQGSKALDHWVFIVFAGAMMLLIVVRHRTNIVRLLKGEENKIGHKK